MTDNKTGGIGFLGLLTIVFITLKLIGKISWPWIWVLSPIWIPFSIVLMIGFGAIVIMGIAYLIDHINKKS